MRSFALLAFALVACDADEDGLSSIQEGKFGTDPKVADSDGDGIIDGDEVDLHGTDPAVWDSDGDGYPDGFEIDRGSDPLDIDSLAYKGGWPYNANADALEADARSGRVAAINKTFPRMEMQDQFGDYVDLYHFANQGVPVIVDISAQWCPPCQQLAQFIEGIDIGGTEQWDTIPDKVANGEVIWLTVIPENDEGDAASRKTVKEWANDFPNDHVPVLADTRREAQEYAELEAWPTLIYLNENLRIKHMGPGWDASVLDAIQDL
jgi:thiol-disulfide isomerase/thioredoxin